MSRKSKYSLRGQIDEALRAAEGMLSDRSNFEPMGIDGVTLPKTLKEVDAFVKETIRLYVESWLLPPLRGAREKLNKPKKL